MSHRQWDPKGKFLSFMVVMLSVGMWELGCVGDALSQSVPPVGPSGPVCPPSCPVTSPSPSPTPQLSPPSPEDPKRQSSAQESTKATLRGIECSSRGDDDCAVRHFQEALALNSGNKAARDHLGLALNRKGNTFFDQRNWTTAIQYYGNALGYKPEDKVIQDNLRKARAAAEAEGRRATDEMRRQQERAAAQTKINEVLDGLAKEFGASHSPGPSSDQLTFPHTSSSDALDFSHPGEPRFSKGSESSAPVDLRFMRPGTPAVVDPRVVKGEMTPEQARLARETELRVRADIALGARMVGTGNYAEALRFLRDAEKLKPDDLGIKKAIGYTLYLRDRRTMPPSPKAEALLDALEYGQGDWRTSVEYLKDLYLKNPNNLPVRDALNFAEGLSGYWSPPGEIPLPPGYKAPFLKGEAHALAMKGVDSLGAREYERAHDYFRKAHQQSPDDLGIRDMVHFSEGFLAAQRSIE